MYIYLTELRWYSVSPDSNIVEGQVIQLEDGSSAYVQHIAVSKAGILLFIMQQIFILDSPDGIWISLI